MKLAELATYLVFDEGAHIYTWKGKVVPSVTQALSYMQFAPDYSTVDPAVLRAAADRGTRIHKAIEEDILGAPIAEWDADQQAGVECFRAFCISHGFKPQVPERRMCSAVYSYAGTCDVEGEMDGEQWIIDFKTSWSISPSWIFQLEGYRVMRNEIEDLPPIQKVGILHMPKTGGYAFVPERKLVEMAGGITDAKIRFLWGVANYHWWSRFIKKSARDTQYAVAYD